jgi:hypothetical protein
MVKLLHGDAYMYCMVMPMLMMLHADACCMTKSGAWCMLMHAGACCMLIHAATRENAPGPSSNNSVCRLIRFWLLIDAGKIENRKTLFFQQQVMAHAAAS